MYREIEFVGDVEVVVVAVDVAVFVDVILVVVIIDVVVVVYVAISVDVVVAVVVVCENEASVIAQFKCGVRNPGDNGVKLFAFSTTAEIYG